MERPPSTLTSRHPIWHLFWRRAGLLAIAGLVALTITGPSASADTGSTMFAGDAGEYGAGPAAPSDPATEATSLRFEDMGGPYDWAKPAVEFVAQNRTWMRDFGDDKFRPGLPETRALFARAMVRAFGDPDAEPDPGTTFSDLSVDDPMFRTAALAVDAKWMNSEGTKFKPDAPVTIHVVYRAIVKMLPLEAEEAGLDDIHDASGYRFKHPSWFATTNLGMRLYLRYSHDKEAADILPTDPMPRAEVAYALRRAATVNDGELDTLSVYDEVELPTMNGAMRRVVEFDLTYVGYPYIWGGEWFKPNGSQPTGGWDCSGWLWWTLKSPVSGYDNTRIRGYRGWSLPQRTSNDMAHQGSRITFAKLKPGNLMFFDGSPGSGAPVDHTNMFIGNGFSMDTSHGAGGTSLLWVKTGWYRDHFRWGRRIM